MDQPTDHNCPVTHLRAMVAIQANALADLAGIFQETPHRIAPPLARALLAVFDQSAIALQEHVAAIGDQLMPCPACGYGKDLSHDQP